jgi:hypothetical protein
MVIQIVLPERAAAIRPALERCRLPLNRADTVSRSGIVHAGRAVYNRSSMAALAARACGNPRSWCVT